MEQLINGRQKNVCPLVKHVLDNENAKLKVAILPYTGHRTNALVEAIVKLCTSTNLHSRTGWLTVSALRKHFNKRYAKDAYFPSDRTMLDFLCKQTDSAPLFVVARSDKHDYPQFIRCLKAESGAPLLLRKAEFQKVQPADNDASHIQEWVFGLHDMPKIMVLGLQVANGQDDNPFSQSTIPLVSTIVPRNGETIPLHPDKQEQAISLPDYTREDRPHLSKP